jgi:hypothetical protein
MSYPDPFTSAPHPTNPFSSQDFNFFTKLITHINLWSQAQKNLVFPIILRIRTCLHVPPTISENPSRTSSAAGTTKLQIFDIQSPINKNDTTNRYIGGRSTEPREKRDDPTWDAPVNF